MKTLAQVLMSIVLLITSAFLPLAADRNVEAADNTFLDIKKITRDTDVSTLYIYEDKLITTFRDNASRPALITSYSKTGELNWEISEYGPHVFTEDRFARLERGILFIYSTDTGKELSSHDVGHGASRMYMNEKFIVLATSTSIAVYNQAGTLIMKQKVDNFRGAALSNSTLVIQDGQGVHSLDLVARKKSWSVPLVPYLTNQGGLKPTDNIIHAMGIEKQSPEDTQLPTDLLIAINATTGAVLFKKEFSKYEETYSRVMKYGFLISHPFEDIHRIYHPDGKVKLEMNLESEAIKQLKQKHFVYGTYYNGNEALIASRTGMYHFKMYDAVHGEFLFSSVKSMDDKGSIKFEKIFQDEYIFDIATTDSDKLFVARGNAFGMNSDTNLLDVYDANGTLLDSIETDYIQHLKADGSTLYGYGGNALYIFKEKASTTVSNKVSHHSTRVIGTAGAGSKITVHAGTTAIGSATVDAAGNYAVPIATQKIGTVLTVVSTDPAGNRSVPIVVTVADGNYPDLRVTHWALKEIMYLGDDRIIGGYPDGRFQPERNATRAEAAKMLAIALKLPVPVANSAYKDVHSSHWAKDYIAAVSKAGLFNGNPDGTFAPDKVLKRAEMAKIISVAYEFKASDKSYFTDVKTGYWAKGYISGLYDNGITTGYPDKTFHPEEATTRAEFSVFLARALNKEFR